MKKIPVEQLKKGMKFDKPVFIDSSNMLVDEKVEITEADIKKLMTWGVSEILTDGNILKSYVKKEPNEKNNNSLISEEVILEKYNDLLKRRKTVIKLYDEAYEAVDEIYKLIKVEESFSTDKLRSSIFNIIEQLKESSNIFLFLYGLDEGKDSLVTHSVSVCFYSLIIAIALKYPTNKLLEVGIGAILIDAGMVKIPSYIVHKQSKLTENEYNQVKTHPVYGYKALKDLGGLSENVALISLQHHEQYDGNGYPRSLRGNGITEYARIVSIADSYESQISHRSYRKKVYFYHAMRNLLSSGVNKFDHVILRIFLARMSVYPIGSIVKLNDSSIGIVIGSIHSKPLRPIIKLVFDIDGKRLKDTVIVNLLKNTELFISQALDEAEAGINIFDVL